MKTPQEWAEWLNHKAMNQIEVITGKDIELIQKQALDDFKASAYSTTNLIRAERIKQAMRKNVII